MKMMYGMCKKEHLLWRCSYDCTDLMIYYWDEDIPEEDELSDVWKKLYDTGFDKGCTIPVGAIKNVMSGLNVHDVGFWTPQGAVGSGPFSFNFNEFLVRLKNGATVAYYSMPDGLSVVWSFNMTPATRVRRFLSFAVPLIWERTKKEISPLQKCDIAIENLKKLIRIYGQDSVFFKVLGNLGRARQEMISNEKNPNHDIFKSLKADSGVIDFIEGVIMDLPANEAYTIGNAIRYIFSYCINGKSIQDLENVKWYINRAIENYKKGEEGE